MNDSLPDDLAKLQARFEHWRHTRKTRSPIPEDLLQAARALLERYSISLVCRVCRLHPASLHKRTKPASSSSQPARPVHKSASTSQTAFYCLPPTVSLPQAPVSTPAAEHCRLVLERTDGARMTLVLPQLDTTALSTLCSNFLRH
jgi:hypothetical protein